MLHGLTYTVKYQFGLYFVENSPFWKFLMTSKFWCHWKFKSKEFKIRSTSIGTVPNRPHSKYSTWYTVCYRFEIRSNTPHLSLRFCQVLINDDLCDDWGKCNKAPQVIYWGPLKQVLSVGTGILFNFDTLVVIHRHASTWMLTSLYVNGNLFVLN